MKLHFSDQDLRPPAREDLIFTNGINHPDVYIWDAWSLTKGDDLYLYTLGTPRKIYDIGGVDIQTQCDHIPHHHRLFISSDAGKSWKDKGPVFWPRSGNVDAFDSRSVWTGSTVHYQGKIAGAFTGIRMVDDNHPFLQSIGLCVSEDGLTFKRTTDEAGSCPIRDYDHIRKTGYFLGDKEDLGTSKGENGGSILAWRDPGLCVDETSGDLHAFWSAKSDTHTAQEPVLAHGIIDDPFGTPSLKLLPPTRLPDAAEFTQAEVPQLLYSKRHKTYYLVVSTTDASTGQSDADLDLNARLYLSPDLGGPWSPAGRLIRKKDGLYPAALLSLEDTDNGVKITFTAPYNRSNAPEIMHTMAECKVAVIENGRVKSIQ